MGDNEIEFQKVYNAFQPKILRYTARLVGENEAEDLTQEIFVKVSRALPDFRGEAKLSTWLYRIATHAALDKLRSPSCQRVAQLELRDDSIGQDEAEIDDRDAWTGEKTPSVEQQVFRKEMSECILRFVEKLPENYRAVLMLSEFEGLRNNEIAEIAGVSLETVKIRLHRARERLKEELTANCDLSWVEGHECEPTLNNAVDGDRSIN